MVVVARLAWQEAVSKLSWGTRVGHISRLAAGLHFFSVFCNLRKTMAKPFEAECSVAIKTL